MVDPAAKVIEWVLGFVDMPSWEAVSVSSELRVKSGEEDLQFFSGLHCSVLGV
jgi:hypothetical protein